MAKEGQGLDEKFYNQKGWLKNVLTFYCETKKKLPMDNMYLPMAYLTLCINNVIDLYGSVPASTHKFLKQTIDPLFGGDEYKTKVFDEIISISEAENDPKIAMLAHNLLTIRKLFARDKAYYMDKFSEEIASCTEGGDNEAKFKLFSTVISEATKVHVGQVVKLIRDKGAQ